MTSDNPEPTAAATQAPPAPVLTIEEGFVNKRGPRPLRLWQKRYFRLPAENHAYPLHKLRIVYRKNAKKQNAAKEDFEKTNKCLLETLATATVNSTSILAYFRSEEKDELPQGFINLKQVDEIVPSPKIRPFAFTIKTKSRDYVFSSNTQSETDSWISTLKSLSSSEIPDFSDTAAYQFSYSQLVDRKGFASPSAPAQDDEVFSASEAELDSDEVSPKEPVELAKPELSIEVPSSETSAAESKPTTVKGESTEGNMSPRKSFYNEVLDFFYRKGPEGEIIKEVKESSPKASTVPEVTEEVTQEVAQVEPAAVETTEEEKPSEFSQEIAEMVAPISSDPPALEPTPAVASSADAAPTDNRPTRSKTFVLPKFEGKMFSKIFKKSNSDQSTPKEESVVALEEPVKEAVEAASPKEVVVDSVKEDAPVTESEIVSVGEVKPEEIPTTIEEAIPEATSEPEVIALVGADEPVALVPEVVTSQEVAPVNDVAVEEIVSSIKEPETVVEDVPEVTFEPVAAAQIKDEDEDTRPFLTRLLSGKRKSKVIETPIVVDEASVSVVDAPVAEIDASAEEPAVPVEDKVISAEVTSEPAASQEEEEIVDSPKQPFIKRLLSGNFKTKSEPIVPVTEQVHEVAELNTEPESVPEADLIPEPVVIESESVPEPALIDEVSEEPASIEPAAENKAEVEASDKKDEIPAPQRQASLMARIGELAYSAVVPTTAAIPEETEEEISEHYDDKIKEAVQSGFLYKQSYLLHTNNLRFFILGQDGVLTYYRSAKVVSEGKKFAINDSTEVSAVEELLLHLKSSNGSIAYFQAKTKEDRDAWFKALSVFAKPVAAEAVVENTEAIVSNEVTEPVSDAVTEVGVSESAPVAVSETSQV